MVLWKRSIYSVVTPLPPTVSRETAVAMLHSHSEMIELNPLVIRHEKCKPPSTAPADEFHAIWYELTDRITYLPGLKGQVSYKACFHDLPRALQTHVYAPAGLEIKEKWSIGGNEPGEEREVIELGHGHLGIPREGLYLREDIDMSCNIFLTSFVKKTLNKAHNVLVQRLVVKADLADDKKVRDNYRRGSVLTGTSTASGLTTGTSAASNLTVTSPRTSLMHSRSRGSMADPEIRSPSSMSDHSFAESTTSAPTIRGDNAGSQPLQSIAELEANEKLCDARGAVFSSQLQLPLASPVEMP
ncbi:hypothetical protein E4T42_00732 [Aureobasidium subglaciale]|uniref:DUF7053 domain-containing protein n=1 Tax=Aureobasidium subglaciale (strain EXF-2481) TaxID=1043005 RepID=A0A074Z033_AURSE|nr:uncharacterized protein AUEXF2481DRAFT_42919 [Aureobasidium subglaciale EXF-2481]KAI5210754.1 hypothetical protein E4T38_01806 [Aureobasidium subglaciale]KAI5229252.1 hypothetical protein E4T40_01674 [Aureobasidium subglaciale]KAI5233005.1 hypothetical protein E4T41_01804 [Aureobasidium subglaciale]KAI5258083.1 hypothetical protein E4T42_00732 [Aureobasidium subglaciale]KAI5266337.1 hypothetical protein E4T46_01671 [Aureobasidium subglaciale]